MDNGRSLRLFGLNHKQQYYNLTEKEKGTHKNTQRRHCLLALHVRFPCRDIQLNSLTTAFYIDNSCVSSTEVDARLWSEGISSPQPYIRYLPVHLGSHWAPFAVHTL